jgi:uncharacterized membrane protein YphA (DoxX/SURF4 family)
MVHLAPLILRLGTGGVLALDGAQRLTQLTTGQAEQAISATASGLDVSATWSSLLGFGEVGIAALLVFGLLTRLAVLPMIGYAAWALVQACGHVGDQAATGFACPAWNANTAGLLMMTVIGATLFISGSGYLGLDRAICRRRNRKKDTEITEA